MNWYEKFQPYWKLESLAQSDGDTGDSAQRVSTFLVLTEILNFNLRLQYEKSMRAHEIVPGRYRRSPVPDYWGSDPTNFSRDQQSILMLCFAINKDKKRLKESMWAIAKRGGFHQNFLRGTDDPTKYWKIPDFLTPFELSVFIRGMDLWILYPLLYVLDLPLILDFLFRKFHKWDYDNMMAQNLFYARIKYPTLVSKLCFASYKYTDFLDCLNNYHTSLNGIKPLAELYKSAYDFLRSKYENSFTDRFIDLIFRLCNTQNRSTKL